MLSLFFGAYNRDRNLHCYGGSYENVRLPPPNLPKQSQTTARCFFLSGLTSAILLAFSVVSSPACALELSSDLTNSQFNDDGSGLLVGPQYSFDGEGGDVNITGTVSGSNAIDCTGNGAPFYFGLQNEGKFTNVNHVTTDTIINLGEMSVNEITITKTGSDAYFMNYTDEQSENPAHAVINGSINVDSAGWVNNTGGSVMDLNGQDAVIGAELANDYGSTLNINANTTFNRSLWNVYGSTMNIADGVTVKVGSGFSNGFRGNPGGTLNAANATIVVTGMLNLFSNTGTATLGSLSVEGSSSSNSGDLTINQELKASMNNSGTMRYNGEAAIQGNLTNQGSVYVSSGNLKLNGRYASLGEKAYLGKNENEALTTLLSDDQISMNGGDLIVTDSIKAQSLSIGYTGHNYSSSVKTKNLTVDAMSVYSVVEGELSSLEVDNLTINGTEYNSQIGGWGAGASRGDGNAQVTVHKSLTMGDGLNLTNYGRLIFDGEEARISGNGTLTNGVSDSRNSSAGLIAAGSGKEKIKNLVVEGNLINTGEIYAETLSVKNGQDGQDEQNSVAFDVDHLNVLEDGGFALNSDTTSLQTVTISKDATLTATDTSLSLTGSSPSVTNQGGVGNFGAVLSSTLSADLSGGQTTIADLTTDSLSVTLHDLSSRMAVSSINDTASATVTVTSEANNGTAESVVNQVSDQISLQSNGKDYAYLIKGQEGQTSDSFEALSGDPTSIVTHENRKLASIAQSTASILMQWRAENTDLNKRMGDLRSNIADTGLWVRTYGGKNEYGSQDVEYKFAAVQLGADQQIRMDNSRVIIGAAFNYTDGDMDYATGSGDAKTYGLTGYASWLHDQGSYVDAMLRLGYLTNEYGIHYQGFDYDGKFSSYGVAASIETGHRFTIKELAFIEPQLQITAGHVGGDTHTTTNGLEVDQQGFNTVVGRVGFMAGINCPADKGKAYVRASVLHEFSGDLTTKFDQYKSVDQDLDGTWYEVGIGASYNINPNTYLYADFECASSGKIDEDYRWNLGLRYNF